MIAERKSFGDLFSTLTAAPNSARFSLELDRLRKYKAKAIIIEATAEQILKGHPHSRANGFLVVSHLMRICREYDITPLLGGTKPASSSLLSAWFLSNT
mgnify:FL=1